MAQGQPGGDEIAERGHRRQADGVPEDGRVPAELTTDRPDDDRDQPEHGRAHQELGVRGAVLRGRPPARVAALGDLQRLAEQFHEPLGGLPRGTLQHLVLLVDAQERPRVLGGTSAGVPRRIERAAASRTSAAASSNSRARSRPGPSAGAPTSGSASAATTGPNSLGESPGAVQDGGTGAGL